jgi:RNA polymerase sigma-70 factor, ECF subfamily
MRLLVRFMIMLGIKRRVPRLPEHPLPPNLVALCLQGDEDAWESLVHSFAGRIFAMSYHYTGRRDEAEDLTQEIFIRIFQNLGSFRAESGTFVHWVLRLSRNLIIDRFRHTRHLRQHGGSAELETLHIEDHGTPCPRRKFEQAEARRILDEALRALPPETQEAVILKDLQGMGYQEMAEVLGVPEGTVKSRLHRGRLALAQSLSRHPARREMQGLVPGLPDLPAIELVPEVHSL